MRTSFEHRVPSVPEVGPSWNFAVDLVNPLFKCVKSMLCSVFCVVAENALIKVSSLSRFMSVFP